MTSLQGLVKPFLLESFSQYLYQLVLKNHVFEFEEEVISQASDWQVV